MTTCILFQLALWCWENVLRRYPRAFRLEPFAALTTRTLVSSGPVSCPGSILSSFDVIVGSEKSR